MRATWAIALAVGALAACDPREVSPPPHHDGGSNLHPGHKDGGTGGGPSRPKDSGTPPAMGPDAMTSPLPPFSDPVCSLYVGATCDGAEDCAPGEVCCGELAQSAPTYESISCRKTCEPPMDYELCHPGDACRDGSMCRRSSLIPQDFIGVCVVNPLVPGGELHGSAIAGEVVCGDSNCQVGVEKCCLRAEVTFGSTPVALPTYCAPREARCDCADKPPPRADAGDESDAG